LIVQVERREKMATNREDARQGEGSRRVVIVLIASLAIGLLVWLGLEIAGPGTELSPGEGMVPEDIENPTAETN
jgi:hypothetical protein